MEEYFDVVDEKGIPTGETVSRSVAHATGVRHRTAHVWIMRRSPEGGAQVLLQKRSQNKDSFPGEYDTSSAGHIQAGDEPLESALRELEEELGIKGRKEDLCPVGTFEISYQEGTERAVIDFISGMTDRYAVHCYTGLFLPEAFSKE